MKKQNGLGIASMVIGIISILLSCTGAGMLGIVGIILSAIALTKKDKAKGMAIAGLITSGLAILISLFSIIIGISIFSGGSSNRENNKESESILETEKSSSVEYLDESEIIKIYSDADSYKGKFVKITGRVFDVQKDEEGTYLQIFQDMENMDNNTLVMYNDKDFDVSEDEYVEVDGEIKGENKGENLVGGTVIAPMIEAKTIKKLSYIDAVVPTIKEINVGKEVNNNGYSLTLEKVEFAEKQTRLYFRFKNEGSENFSLNWYSAKVIQDSTQFEMETDYNANYEQLQDEVMPGIETSGILTFKGMDAEKPAKIYVSGYDNENYEEISFEFEVTE